jgi:DNA-damage-inducible protein D
MTLLPFSENQIRKTWHNEMWYFSIVDVVGVLSESPTPRQYWEKVKSRMSEEEANQTSPNWVQLKMLASDGKKRSTDCANTEGILRIIQSVPSPKAEPFKMWLAEVGAERLEEINSPELAIERATKYYRAKGYSDEWITIRLQGIDTRDLLTEEWKNRGVKEGKEYSILTAVISKGTFDITPTEHKALKGLGNQSLRDNMTPLELIFTALGEQLTRETAIENDAQGFVENKDAAAIGGAIAGKARKAVEAERNIKVVSSTNHLKKLGKGTDKK